MLNTKEQTQSNQNPIFFELDGYPEALQDSPESETIWCLVGSDTMYPTLTWNMYVEVKPLRDKYGRPPKEGIYLVRIGNTHGFCRVKLTDGRITVNYDNPHYPSNQYSCAGNPAIEYLGVALIEDTSEPEISRH